MTSMLEVLNLYQYCPYKEQGFHTKVVEDDKP